MNDYYDKKAFYKYTIGLFAIMAALYASKGVAFCVLGPILLMLGMRNPITLLYYLMMAIAMMMCNSHIVPKTLPFALTQRALMFVVAFSLTTQIFGRRKSSLVTPLWGIMVYLVYMILPSVMGWNLTISGLKLILFTAVFCAYFGVANRIILNPGVRGSQVRSVFLAFCSFFIFGSMALIPFPGISLMNPYDLTAAQLAEIVSLYMGMTLHSQALGPVVTILAVALFADLVFSVRRFDKLYVLLLLCAPVLVYKTSSRTAMGGLFVGLAFVVFVLMQARGVSRVWRSRIVGIGAAVVFLGLLAAAFTPSVRQHVVQFLIKFDKNAQSSDVTFENVTSTRTGRVQESLWGFRQSPAIGNGFQVSYEYKGQRLPVSKLLSAPVEKGVWVTAVLEEGGVIGLIIFGGFVLAAASLLWKRQAYTTLCTFVTMLVLNLGEMTVFSMSSVGGLTWAVVFIGAMLDGHRLKFKSVAPPPMELGPMRDADLYVSRQQLALGR